MCWGYNSYGKLGNGSTVKSPIPVNVAGLTSGVIAITAGGYHTCAVARGGAVECWGYNGAGRLGNGSTTTSSVPIAVPALPSGVSAVAAGQAHTCAVASGVVKCWGYGGYGQLGNGRMFNSKVPVTVDFATYQTIDLHGSRPQGPIASGTAITFTADVRPLLPTGVRATVRFEIFRDEGDEIHLAARRDVVANASGRALLGWTFVTIGQRHVRAKALANVNYAASPWSAELRYYVSSEP
jgi:hypothetical protein